MASRAERPLSLPPPPAPLPPSLQHGAAGHASAASSALHNGEQGRRLPRLTARRAARAASNVLLHRRWRCTRCLEQGADAGYSDEVARTLRLRLWPGYFAVARDGTSPSGRTGKLLLLVPGRGHVGMRQRDTVEGSMHRLQVTCSSALDVLLQ